MNEPPNCRHDRKRHRKPKRRKHVRPKTSFNTEIFEHGLNSSLHRDVNNRTTNYSTYNKYAYDLICYISVIK